MVNRTILESARFIFSNGSLIHERIMRAQTEGLSICDNDGLFSELSTPQVQMIMMIHKRKQVSVTELSDLLCVSPPSVSTMVDRLVEKGVVRREPSVIDRRKVVISLTPQAIDNMGAIEEKILGVFMHLVEALGPETTKKWCDVLGKIRLVLEKELNTGFVKNEK